jgi:glycosyltransferase involved in cell wall biosynthesis
LRIVFASHTATTSDFVVGSHHLARQCAAMGHRVAHLVAPVSLAHLARYGDGYTRRRFANWVRGGEVGDGGVFEYVPLSAVPWQLARYFLRIGNSFLWTMPPVGSVLWRHGFGKVDVLLVDQPKMLGIERILRPEILVYRATDLYAELTGDGCVALAEAALARRADLLVATAGPILERLARIAPEKPRLLLENGVDVSHFEHARECPPEYSAVPDPRAVYVGALDARFNWDWVVTAARSLPALHIVLIGPVRGDIPDGLPANLHLLGPIGYERLPGFLQHGWIGLLPTTSHRANRGRSPMKLYEYAAAGLPVLAAETEELTRRRLPFVCLVRDREQFVSALQGLALDPEMRRELARSAHGCAATRDWSSVTTELLAGVRKAASEGPRRTGSAPVRSD